MVRRGSTVRVRQRACTKAPLVWGFLHVALVSRLRDGDHARVLLAPHLKALASGAERQSRRRRPVGHAYRGGGAVHPVESTPGPDRITAKAHALGVLGVEPTAGAAGSLREQHLAGGVSSAATGAAGAATPPGGRSLATYSTRPRSHAVRCTVSPK
jgi:hypothetical protein